MVDELTKVESIIKYSGYNQYKGTVGKLNVLQWAVDCLVFF